MAIVDRNWHWGVPGWIYKGQHMTLRQMVDLFPERKAELIAEHWRSMLLLGLVLWKLRREADEL